MKGSKGGVGREVENTQSVIGVSPESSDADAPPPPPPPPPLFFGLAGPLRSYVLVPMAELYLRDNGENFKRFFPPALPFHN